MKTKTKLVLAASSLSCAAIAGLGASTFAWFVTQNNVGIVHSQLVITTANPSLSLTLTPLIPSSQNQPTTINSVETIDDLVNLTDVSSEFGETFYKKADSGDDYYKLMSAQELAGSVLSFGVKVSTLGMNTARTLNFTPTLSSNSPSISTSVRQWIRTGIYECTDDTYATPMDGGRQLAFMYKKNASNCDKYVNGTGENDIASIPSLNLQTYGSSLDLKSGIKDATNLYFKISVWLEGTTNVNQDPARGASFTVATMFSLDLPNS